MTVTYTNPAQNICGDYLPSGRPYLHCSLVCCGADEENGGIGWPMHSGNLQVWLYSETCGGEELADTRLWQPGQFNIPLSCSQDADPDAFTCTWTGKAEASTDHGTCLVGETLVPQGFRIRLSGQMTALDFNNISASFTIERLAAGDDFTPPVAGNHWITCGTGGGICHRVVSGGTDPNDKQIPRTFVSELITLGSSGSICGDAKYARIVVMLLPWRFGCHVSETVCALAQSGSYYSCLQAYIEPIDIPQDTEPATPSWEFLPQFAQIGVYDPFDISQCLAGHSNDPGVDASLFLCGCPGEGPDLKQQIQYRTGVAGFELIVKSVEGEAGLCVALRSAGVGTYAVQTPAVIQEAGPWIAYADFAGLGARVKLFGLKFPEGAVAGCTSDGTYVPWVPPPPIVYHYWKVCGPPGEDGIPDEETEGEGPAVDDDYISFCLPYPEGEDPSEFYLFAFGPYLTAEDCEMGMINGAASFSCDPTDFFCWAICKPRIFGGSGVAYCLCIHGNSLPPEDPAYILHWPDPFGNAMLCDAYLGPFSLECDA